MNVRDSSYIEEQDTLYILSYAITDIAGLAV